MTKGGVDIYIFVKSTLLYLTMVLYTI